MGCHPGILLLRRHMKECGFRPPNLQPRPTRFDMSDGWTLAAAQIMHFAEAEADCDKALAREMSVKTLLRRGTARRGKRDLDGASSDFKHALSLEPKNRCACGRRAIYVWLCP